MPRTTTPVTEQVARGVGVAALVAALLLSLLRLLRPDGAAASGSAVVISGDLTRDDAALARTLAARLVQGGSRDASDPWPVVVADLRTLPTARVRGILASARAAGMSVRWHDSIGVRDLFLDAAPVASPAGGTLVYAAMRGTPSSSAMPFRVRDAGGVLDSTGDGRQHPLRLRASALNGPVHAEVFRSGVSTATASVPVPTAAIVRRVRVYAQPGWESKFVAAALEENGWTVDGTLTVSPKARVRLGDPMSLDTARYSVAVVLDSGVAEARALRQFLGQGGGVIIAGDASRDPALRDAVLAGGRIARIEDERPPVAGALLTDEPRRGIAAYHLAPGPSAVVLEREGAEAIVVGGRRGAGRVVVSGYRETWRWRMEGRDESADAHRTWWNALLAAAAFVPSERVAGAASSPWPGDAAPVADLVARLGPSTEQRLDADRPALHTRVPLWLLYVVSAFALLLEWALRRLRGAA
jgi:hypothetical protein